MNEKEQVPYSLLRSEVFEEEDDPISQRDTDPCPPPEEESPESDGKPYVQVNITGGWDDGLD